MKKFLLILSLALFLSLNLSTNRIGLLAATDASDLNKNNMQKDTQTYEDSEYGWKVKYPDTWSKEIAFENNNLTNKKVISKRILFYTSFNEIVTVDIWKEDEDTDIINNFKDLHDSFLLKQDREVSINGEIAGVPAILASNLDHTNGNIMHKVVLFKRKRIIFRIVYSIKTGLSEDEFTNFLKDFSLNNIHPATKLENLKSINNKNEITLSVSQAVAEDTCGPNGEYTLTGNPFPCASICTKTKTNCTWWAIYKRPDLKTKITWGNAGSDWTNQAEEAGLPTSSIVNGAIVVWEGHVAYVNSYTSSNSFNISEMNCDNTDYPGPRDANVKGNYGDSYNFTLDGFIGFATQTDIIIQNQNITSGTYNATNSIKLLPEVTLNPSIGTITMNIQ